ncbi:hypothetical protein HNQ56_003131 [Anaerotaenia torta]
MSLLSAASLILPLMISLEENGDSRDSRGGTTVLRSTVR